MCYTDQCSRWPYAPSCFPNRQHTRNTNRCYRLLTCATVQSVTAPAFLSSFSVLETSFTTVWLFSSSNIYRVHPCSGLNVRVEHHSCTLPGVGLGWWLFPRLIRPGLDYGVICSNPSLLRDLQSASSVRWDPDPIFCKITKKGTSQPVYLLCSCSILFFY